MKSVIPFFAMEIHVSYIFDLSTETAWIGTPHFNSVMDIRYKGLRLLSPGQILEVSSILILVQ